jgi:hypothetical protein
VVSWPYQSAKQKAWPKQVVLLNKDASSKDNMLAKTELCELIGGKSSSEIGFGGVGAVGEGVGICFCAVQTVLMSLIMSAVRYMYHFCFPTSIYD